MVRHMRIAAAVLIGAVVSSPVGLAAVSAFAVGIAVNAQQAQAQAFRFSNFVIEGNQRITDETIISYTGITPGAGVSAGEVNDALQSLQDSGLFERVELIPRGGTLEIRVLEYPTINRIAIEGNRPHRRRRSAADPAIPDTARLFSDRRRAGRSRHRRGLSRVGPPDRNGDAGDHPARRQPRGSRLRGDRGQRGGNPAHRLRRQPRVFGPPPAPGAGKHAGRAVRVDHPVGHLHRGPYRARPAAVDGFLLRPGLYRLSGPVGHAGTDARARRLFRDVQHSRGAELPASATFRSSPRSPRSMRTSTPTRCVSARA